MRYRPSPHFVVLVLALLAFGYIMYVIPDTLARYALEQAAEKATAPSPRQTYGPDIRHCLDGSTTQPLWDCIRYVKE